jgi:ribonuclease-3
MKFDELQAVLSYHFSQVKYLERALTHSSYANERNLSGNNERLEFLGDAVLELAVSQMLYRRFPDVPEGVLTKLRANMVSEPALAELAEELGLDRLVLLGRGEELQGGRERASLLSDALEAVFGAVYLDGGYEAAEHCIESLMHSRVPEAELEQRPKDAKSRLQEATQKIWKDRPVYTLVGSEGPEHSKVFEVRLDLPDGTELTGRGPSVKKAEQKAAAKALTLLGDKTRL